MRRGRRGEGGGADGHGRPCSAAPLAPARPLPGPPPQPPPPSNSTARRAGAAGRPTPPLSGPPPPPPPRPGGPPCRRAHSAVLRCDRAHSAQRPARAAPLPTLRRSVAGPAPGADIAEDLRVAGTFRWDKVSLRRRGTPLRGRQRLAGRQPGTETDREQTDSLSAILRLSVNQAGRQASLSVKQAGRQADDRRRNGRGRGEGEWCRGETPLSRRGGGGSDTARRRACAPARARTVGGVLRPTSAAPGPGSGLLRAGRRRGRKSHGCRSQPDGHPPRIARPIRCDFKLRAIYVPGGGDGSGDVRVWPRIQTSDVAH